jgi:hypothetical protein
MLKQPRRLPQRYRRPVTPQMRSLVQRRHQRQKQYRKQRFVRAIQKFQRRAGSIRRMILRYAMVLAVSFVLLAAGLVLFSPILDVREIQVRRADPRIDAEEIRTALSPFFGQHLLLLGPEHVRRAVEDAIPDADEVTVTKQYPSTLILGVTPDPIVAQLFIEHPSPPAGTGALTGSGAAPETADYLTDEGVYMAYLPSQVRTGTGLLDLHVVDWAVRPESGKPLVQSGLLLAMQKAEDILQQEFSLPVESRTVFLRAREFHIQVPGYSLWFDLRSPLDEQFARYRIFLEYVGVNAVKEYVDLRIRKMIVYK